MTGLLDQLLGWLPLAAPPAITAEARNVLQYPAATPAVVTTGPLAHTEGGLVTDASLRPRVSVLLGPGATFQGIADTITSLYGTAAAAGGPAAPSRNDLARAVVVYNQNYLPAGDWRNHRVGLRLPLPVEIDPATGNCIVNSDSIRTWAASFPAGWRARLTTAPDPLDLPDPLILEGSAAAIVAAHLNPEELAADLWTRALRNPFDEILTIMAALRNVQADPAMTVAVALAMLDTAVSHQLGLLASTHPGNALVRRLGALLANAPPATDQARLTRARDLITGALWQGPAGQLAMVPHRELPETKAQLVSRGPLGTPQPDVDSRGGHHRICLGRDVAIGSIVTEVVSGVAYRGPAYVGRLKIAPVLAADAARINPTNDVQIVARLAIIVGIAANEGSLDAVRARDRGILSSGVHQWSAHAPKELPSLLFRFKTMAPDEFDLFFAIYGLDVAVDPAHPNQYLLQQIAPDGQTAAMEYNAIRTFLGGSIDQNGVVIFTTDWAARFRLPPLVSEAYRRCEILEALGRFDRIATDVGTIHIGGAAPADIPLAQLISSQQGVALILDSHINLPDRVRPVLRADAHQPLPADDDGRDRTITARYYGNRAVYKRKDRNDVIDNQQFNPAHLSFTGW